MKVEISRRRFLQGTVALSVVGGTTVSATNILSASEHKTSNAKDKDVPTVCEMCVNKCTAIAKVRNGIVKKLDPNPMFPKSRNMLCARGAAGIHALYDPDRLKYPLIRVGERGDGKYKRATWEEAYEAILNGTDKFKGLAKILEEEEDNRSTIGYCAGEGMGEHTFKAFLSNKLGSPNFVNHSSICLQTAVSGYALTIGGYGETDLANCEYVIMAGANRAEAIVTPDTMDMFKRTNGRGLRLICVDPRYSNTASKADKWVPIKVGTDLAFVLALTYVAISENLYNKKFVEEHFNNFEDYKAHVLSKGYTPEWAAKITGVKADDIIQIARDFMAYAPRAAYYQGRRTAWSKQDFQLRRAQAIFTALGGGIDQKGGIVFGKGLPLGSHDINGPIYANTEGRLEMGEAAIIGGAGSWIAWRNMILEGRGDYPIRAFFMYKQNPVLSVPHSQKTIDMIKGRDLVVAIDTMPTDSVLLADVILPECTYLEKEDPVKAYGGTQPAIILRNKVIEPLYESKPVFDICKGLAEKLSKPLFEISKKFDEDVQAEMEDRSEEEVYEEDGFDLTDMFHETQEHINEHMVVAKHGKEAYEFLKQFGVYYPGIQENFKKINSNEYSYYPEEKKYFSVKEGKFQTPSGKIECNLESMAKKGVDPMPTWRDELFTPTPRGKFRYISGRHAQFTQNATQNNAMLLDLIRENYIWINKSQAKEMGIKFGDVVEVKSKAGKVQIKAYPTDKIIPNTVYYVHGFGSQSEGLTFGYRNGASDNAIIEDVIETVFGSAAMHETDVEIKKV